MVSALALDTGGPPALTLSSPVMTFYDFHVPSLLSNAQLTLFPPAPLLNEISFYHFNSYPALSLTVSIQGVTLVIGGPRSLVLHQVLLQLPCSPNFPLPNPQLSAPPSGSKPKAFGAERDHEKEPGPFRASHVGGNLWEMPISANTGQMKEPRDSKCPRAPSSGASSSQAWLTDAP